MHSDGSIIKLINVKYANKSRRSVNVCFEKLRCKSVNLNEQKTMFNICCLITLPFQIVIKYKSQS